MNQEDAKQEMREEVISLTDTHTKTRLRLQEFLLSIGETIFKDSIIFDENNDYKHCIYILSNWSGINKLSIIPISIDDFINKYKYLKNDGSAIEPKRNLGFRHRNNKCFTYDEYIKLCEYVGYDTGLTLQSFETGSVVFDDGEADPWFYAWSIPVPISCEILFYEDIFPEDATLDTTNNSETTVKQQSNNIALKSHYKKHKIEPIEIINEYNLNFNVGNIIKYVLRSPYKGTQLDDLIKARDYIDYEIKRLRGLK